MKNDYVIVSTMGHYLIKEKKTDQYLISYDLMMPAQSMCGKLNKGSGFEGETPAFFTKKIVQVNLRKLTSANK